MIIGSVDTSREAEVIVSSEGTEKPPSEVFTVFTPSLNWITTSDEPSEKVLIEVAAAKGIKIINSVKKIEVLIRSFPVNITSPAPLPLGLYLKCIAFLGVKCSTNTSNKMVSNQSSTSYFMAKAALQRMLMPPALCSLFSNHSWLATVVGRFGPNASQTSTPRLRS